MTLRVLLIVSGIALVACPGRAEAQVVSSVISSSSNWGATTASRRAQASEWLEEVAALLRQVPTLSPSEAAWLKVEYDDQLASNNGAFTPRASRARHSKEGSARFARPVLTDIATALGQLASAMPLLPVRETALWSSVAYLTLDLNLWGDVSHLGELGVIARSPESRLGTPGFQTYQEALRSIWASRAQSILGAIVVPYLNRAG